MNSGETAELDLFPMSLGGAIPTSPLQFKVVPIEKSLAANLFSKYHYLGDKDFLNVYSFGALFDGILWGLSVLGFLTQSILKGSIPQMSSKAF